MAWKVVEFQDETGEIMVARVPPEGTAELASGSQLIVQDGQIAAFFHDGRPTDAFRAGRFDLSTQNIPVLSKILRLTTLSRSPFRSYIYFIALKTFTNMGWGTSSPILFRDSEFRMVNLRANGAFAVRIASPKTFLTTIVGTQGVETTFALQEYLRKIIVSRLAETLPAILTSVVDLPQRYSELAVRVKKAIHDDFEQYGLELVDLLIEAITLPEEVQQAINRAAGVRAVARDEIGHYAEVIRSNALQDAARTPGSEAASGLTAGLGLGAGIQVMKEMAGSTALNAAPQATAKLNMDQVKTKLRELKDLLAEDLITQEDFNAQKKRLLDQV